MSRGRHVEVFKGDGGWYRRLVAGNNQKLGTDGPYEGDDNDGKANAIAGARTAWPGVMVYVVGDKGRRLLPHPAIDGVVDDAGDPVHHDGHRRPCTPGDEVAAPHDHDGTTYAGPEHEPVIDG